MDIDLTKLPAEAIATTLHFFRGPNPNHSLVLMEGPIDVAFWTEFKVELSILFPAGSKEKLVQVLEIANHEGELEGIAALIDPDCWLAEGSEKLNTPNLLYYDVPDLEVMVLKSPVLEKVLRNTLSFVPTAEASEFSQLLTDDIWRLGTNFGHFRQVGCRNPGFGLKLRTVSESIGEHINPESLELVECDLANALLGNEAKLTAHELMESADSVRSECLSQILLVGGKDLMSILAFVFPIKFRSEFVENCRHERIDERTLERMKAKLQTDGGGDAVSLILRNAYDRNYLSETIIRNRIRTWESSSKGDFKILAEDI